MYAESFRCVAAAVDPPAAFSKHLLNGSLDRLQRRAASLTIRRVDVEVVSAIESSVEVDERPLDDVLEFAHVAGPPDTPAAGASRLVEPA